MSKFLDKYQQAKEARLELENKRAKAAEETVKRKAAAMEREARKFKDSVGIFDQVMDNLRELTDLEPATNPYHTMAKSMCPLNEFEDSFEILTVDKQTLTNVYYLQPGEVRSGGQFSAVVTFMVAVITRNKFIEGLNTEPWDDDAKTILLGQVYLSLPSGVPQPVVFWLTEQIDPMAADPEEVIEAIAAGCSIAETFVEVARSSTGAGPTVKMNDGSDAAMNVFKEYLKAAPKSLYPSKHKKLKQQYANTKVAESGKRRNRLGIDPNDTGDVVIGAGSDEYPA